MAVLLVVLATVLLANDKHNLRVIAEHYKLTSLNLEPVPALVPPLTAASSASASPSERQAQGAAETPKARPVRTFALAPRGARVIPVRPAVGNPVPLRFFAGPQPPESDFLRRWKVSGATLCRKISAAGVAIGRWRPSDFDSTTSECSFETPVAASDTTADPPSLFAIVRGSEKGDIATIRIKAILPDTPAGKAMKERFVALVRLLIDETQWNDFEAAADRMERMENVTQTSSGIKLTFAREIENARRFNMIIELDRATPEQERTAEFFDATRRLPMPRHFRGAK
jgi:hypothetical protein